MLNSVLSTKETTHDCAGTDIKNAQVKQQRDYKRSHQLVYSYLNSDDKVLLPNQKRQNTRTERVKNSHISGLGHTF